MTLGRRLTLYLVLLHLLFAGLALWFLRDQRPWLLLVEMVFVVSFVAGYRLVRAAAEPGRLLAAAARQLSEGDFTTRLLPTGRPELDELVDLHNRIVDRLRRERIHNEEQETFLHRILGASPVGIITLDLDDRISAVNPGAEALLGPPATGLVGRRLAELDSPFGRSLAELPPGGVRVLPLSGARRVRGRKLHFIDRGFTRHFLLLEELTEELRRSEKAAYDRLIRLMSHEVNNTSGAVSSLLESCLHYRGQIDADHRDDFARAIEVSTSRLSHMNLFMKQFADVVRLPPPRRRPESLAAILGRLELLLEPECRRRAIRWEARLGSGLAPVPLDAGQVEQALLNILRNALESIDRDGTVMLELSGAGRRQSLVIADTGPGIPPELADQLFTPFFTTKENGQGIGLTLVREILIAHGCDFSLETREGRTEFAIQFPVD